jgi:integrase
MPRTTPDFIPAYRKHKGTGQAVVTLNGRAYYLGRHGSKESRATYNRLIAEWLAGGRRLPDADNGLTVSELIRAFWPHVETHYRRPDGTPTNEVGDYKLSLRPLRELYGRTPAKDFGPLALKAVRQRMVEAGLCRGVVNQRIGRIRRMFRWATENELVPLSSYHGLIAVRGLERGRSEARESEGVKPVPLAIVEETLPHMSRTVRAMVETQLLTGMRPGELVIMRACDLDMAGAVWLYTPPDHKTAHHGHKRIIAVGPKAQAILKPFLTLDTQAYLFSPASVEAERRAELHLRRKTKVQPSQVCRRKRKPERQPGERYTTASYGRAIDYACAKAWPLPEHLAARPGESRKAWKARLTPEAKAEIRAWKREHSWHPHQLRHTRATELRRQFGLDAARTILGHRSPQVTEQYAELDLGRAVEIIAKVG